MKASTTKDHDNLRKWAEEYIKQAKAILAHKANVEKQTKLAKDCAFLLEERHMWN